jgi:peptidoglycan hydrolase-like protein with peptidoglycan-binding domain
MRQTKLRFLSALLALVLVLSVCFSAMAAYSTIPFGTESSDVTSLQKALKSKGYYKGEVDGKFGQSTRSAVYRYQKAVGITADGKAGNMTLTALYDGLSAANNIDSKKAHGLVVKNSKTMYYGCRGDNVKSLQKLLKKAGFFKGTADGKYGDLTLSAVKRFQWSVGLSGDGLAGTKTLDALKKATKAK